MKKSKLLCYFLVIVLLLGIFPSPGIAGSYMLGEDPGWIVEDPNPAMLSQKFFRVEGSSMEPTHHHGDLLQLVSAEYEEGDVVLVQTAGDGRKTVKRIVHGELVGDNRKTSVDVNMDGAIVLGKLLPAQDRTIEFDYSHPDFQYVFANAVQVAAGESHSLALLQDGSVWAWGYNGDGQIGDGSKNLRKTPVPVFGLDSGVTAIAAGGHHSMAIQNGAAKAWGRNVNGQLGDSTLVSKSKPVQVSGLTSGVTAIACGGDHSLAVQNESAKAWGKNNYSQLGDNTTSQKGFPVQVSGLTSGVTSVSAGKDHSLAIQNGSAKAWGNGDRGKLGDGSGGSKRIPVQVSGLTSGVTAIAAGTNHSLAIHNGSVKAWGDNQFGQLGNRTTYSKLVPTLVYNLTSEATAIAAGDLFSMAVQNGTLFSWGYNNSGKLGLNSSMVYTNTPTKVHQMEQDVTAIATGSKHALAFKSGKLFSWGYNYYGQLGDNTTATRNAPVFVVEIPTNVEWTVNHYGESLEGDEYLLLKAENFSGKAGDLVHATPSTIEGFLHDPEHVNTIESLVLSEDSPNVLSLFYSRTSSLVEFDENGGSAVSSQNIPYEGYATKPGDPIRPGYSFGGWELSGTLFDFENTPVIAPIVLTARWEEETVIPSEPPRLDFISDLSRLAEGIVSIRATGSPDVESILFEGITYPGNSATVQVTKNGKYTFVALSEGQEWPFVTYVFDFTNQNVSDLVQVDQVATDSSVSIFAQANTETYGTVRLMELYQGSARLAWSQGSPTLNATVKEPGLYDLNIDYRSGHKESIVLEVEEFRPADLTFSVDESDAENGVVRVTATATGKYDGLSFNGQAGTGNSITVEIHTNGTHVFQVEVDGTTKEFPLVIRSLPGEGSDPFLPQHERVTILKTPVSGGISLQVEALTPPGDYLRIIEVYEGEKRLSRALAQNLHNHLLTRPGEYEVRLYYGKSEPLFLPVLVPEFPELDVAFEVDSSTFFEGFITLSAHASGEVAAIKMGDIQTEGGTISLPVTKNGLHRLQVWTGNQILTFPFEVLSFPDERTRNALLAEEVIGDTSSQLQVSVLDPTGSGVRTIELYRDGVRVFRQMSSQTDANIPNLMPGIYELRAMFQSLETLRLPVQVKGPAYKLEIALETTPEQETFLNVEAVSLRPGETVESIRITGPLGMQSYSAAAPLRLLLTENGQYLIEAVGAEGGHLSKELLVSSVVIPEPEPVPEPEISFTVNTENIRNGSVLITATVSGEHTKLIYGETETEEGSLAFEASKDGAYTVRVLYPGGEKTETFHLTEFSEVNSAPEVSVEREGYTLNIVATPYPGTSIRSIAILKGETQISRVLSRASQIFTVDGPGEYTIVVTNSKLEETRVTVTVE